MITYRRHRPECSFFCRPRHATGNLTCGPHRPIWAQGSLSGKNIRRRLGLASWDAATELVRGWKVTGKIGGAPDD
jgi:hypothetical protein